MASIIAAQPGPPRSRNWETAARVADRLLASVDELVRHMGDEYCLHVPEYRALGPEEIETKVLPVTRAVVETFFGALACGGEPRLEEVGGLRESGRRRMEMGIPLEPMLHVYRVAGRAVWQAVVAATRPGEEPVLGELGVAWFDFIDRASSAAAAGYLEASHDHLRELDAGRRALLEGMLAASDTGDAAALAAHFSVPVAPAYVPVLLDGRDAQARLDAIAAAAPPASLCGPWGRQLMVLLPETDAGRPELARAGAGLLIASGLPCAPGAALRAEVADVAETISAARLMGRTEGVFGPDDFLVERLMAGRPRLAERLAAPVSRLAGHDRNGALATTLAAHLACGSVPETARRVFVHPNTVAYRLARVAEITGLDPRVPDEAAQLVLAIAASRVHKERP